MVITDEAIDDAQITIIPVFLAKGIEFDGCIIANAGSDRYPADDMHGRLLYVAVTRALHELVVLWNGDLSEHLTPVNKCGFYSYEALAESGQGGHNFQ